MSLTRVTVSPPRSRPTWMARARRFAPRVGVGVVVYGGGLVMLVPFLWMLSTSLKSQGSVFLYPPRLFPSLVRWDNYPAALTSLPFWRFYLNSSFVTVLATAGQLVSASLAGYAFARLKARARDFLFLMLISTMLLPEQVLIIPQFIVYRTFGFVDTWVPLILPSWLGIYAFYIFLCRQFFLTLPLDMDDAAKVDGASHFTIYRRIILPLSKPVLASVAVFSFLFRWNDFFNPVIYLTTTDRFTMPLGLSLFQDYDGTQWPWLMAASVVALLPCLIVFFAAQRLFVRGIATTGLKG